MAWVAVATLLVGDSAQAADPTSPSHRHRAGTFASIGVARLPSAASEPRYAGSIVSLGASIEVEPSGRPDSLRAVLPGFFWIEAGRSDFLDLDGDGAAFFLDADDDGDGLLDVHETGTGAYVSPQNTGTSAVRADTDGDGYSDGAEVAGGTDPTDPGSHPGGSPAVPLLSGFARLVLALLLFAAGSGSLASRSSRSTGRRST
ncbi:MAG: hypothetical protein IPK00_06690 [Deltaproteobacteria bacterium]|nr:hypothetical protein [Deltaproteobacteria bacterium]